MLLLIYHLFLHRSHIRNYIIYHAVPIMEGHYIYNINTDLPPYREETI